MRRRRMGGILKKILSGINMVAKEIFFILQEIIL